jgi:general secretion pathway protein G
MLELTLVLAIIGILTAVTVALLAGQGDRARVTTTRTTLVSIKGHLESYQLEYKAYPTDLMIMVNERPPRMGQALLKDAWGRDVVYDARGTSPQRPFVLGSAGPDGIVGTEDDIDAWSIGN